jgi:hypothetical protein
MSKNAKVKKYEAKGKLGEKKLQEYFCLLVLRFVMLGDHNL